MAFYSMHEGARLASERAVPNASGRLIGQHCGTMLKGAGRKNGRGGTGLARGGPLALTSRGRNAPARQRWVGGARVFDLCCGPLRRLLIAENLCLRRQLLVL